MMKEKVLKHIADQLGVATRKIFEITAKAQPTKAALNLGFFGVITTIPAVIGLAVYKRQCGRIGDEVEKTVGTRRYKREDAVMAGVVAGIVSLILIVIGWMDIHQAVLQLTHPKYMALKEIARTAGGAT